MANLVNSKGNVHIMMTPDDFLRSITPGIKQPEKLGLDKYVTLNNRDEVLQLVQSMGMHEDSIFHQLVKLAINADYLQTDR